MRFLWHAFFARPDIPLLRLPWNALAMVAAGIAGFWDPLIWTIAGTGEMIYLFTMASNPGFQQWIRNRVLEDLHGDTEEARKRLMSRLGGAARQRYIKLEERRKRLEALERDQPSDDLFAESNRHALQKLTWLYLNLLVAQRNIIVAPASDERDLQKQIAAYERELHSAKSPTARSSIEATLRLLRERLDNIQHRETSLEEIDADLARIETQLDLALEEATLRGRTMAISANVELTSRLLGNVNEPSLPVFESSSDLTSRQLDDSHKS